MKKWISSILLMLGMMFILTGCGDSEESDNLKNELKAQPVSRELTIEMLNGMSEDALEDELTNTHLEVSGIISKKGVYIVIGDKKNDEVYVNCIFADYDDEKLVEEGEYLKVDGVCTDVIGDTVYLYECTIVESGPAEDFIVTKEIPAVEEETVVEESELTDLPIIVETPEVEEEVEVVEKSEPVVEPEPQPEPEPAPQPEPEPQPAPEPAPQPEPEPQPAPAPAPEPEPQPAPQQQSSGGGSGVTVPDHNEAGANLVWVPTKGGTKYHSKSSCSGMEGPMQVTVETATANGYTPCKRCH